MPCKLFVDTMIFLHYRPLPELGLFRLLATDQITVVVPRITLRELDKHKSTHLSRKVRDRARRVLADLEAAITSSQQLAGMFPVEYFDRDSAEDISKLGLNPQWNDDLLIACAIKYQDAVTNNDDRVVVLTQDTGPRLTCRAHKIATERLDEALRLPDEPDPLEKENRDLIRQVQQLQSALPRFEITILGGEEPGRATFALKPPDPVDDNAIQRSVDLIKTQLPPIPPPMPTELGLPGFKMAFADVAVSAIPPDEYERYEKERDKYFRNLTEYLKQVHEHSAIVSRTIEFQIQIENTGTGPAEDVDILLYFPDGFALYTADDYPAAPTPPNPPKKPMSRTGALLENISSYRDFQMPALADIRMPSSFKIRQTNSFEVREHYRRIKHGDSVALPVMVAEFPSFEDAHSFHCAYTIRPANLTKPVTGELHFIINKPAAAT